MVLGGGLRELSIINYPLSITLKDPPFDLAAGRRHKQVQAVSVKQLAWLGVRLGGAAFLVG